MVGIVNSIITADGDYIADLSGYESNSWNDGSAILLRGQNGYADGSELTLTIDDKTEISSTAGNGIRVYVHKDNTETSHGVDSITVDYYSNMIISGQDVLKVENPTGSFTTVTPTDLAQ